MTTREWGKRRGRGGARANSGGRRAGAGRPKTDDVGYVAVNVRLGPEQIERAQALAAELGVPIDEVCRRALHGQAQLGAATPPFRRYPLRVTPATLTMLEQRANGGALAPIIRGILSGDIVHL